MGKGRRIAITLGGLASIVALAANILGDEPHVFAAGVVGIVGIAVTYWFSDQLAIRSERAELANSNRYPHYHLIVRELCHAQDLPMPALYVSPNAEPNAFASGSTYRRSVVCISEGLIKTLSWDEIRAVLAHELSHIQSRDLLTGSVGASLLTAICFASNMVLLDGLASLYAGFEADRASAFRYEEPAIVVVGFALLAPIVAGLMHRALGRSLEFDADREAAALVGIAPVADVLRSLERPLAQIQPAAEAPRPGLGFRYAHWAESKAESYDLLSLVASHPTPDERIRRLCVGDRLRAIPDSI